ncbi:MAG: 16S rRNA (cytidine(1402)-2'-O)-methyltransferase, partial [Bacilli bacterium]
YRGTVKEVIEETKDIKGEIVFLIEGNNEVNDFNDITINEQINMFIEEGFSQMEAIKKVSKLRNIPKSEIYNKYHNK